MSELTIPDESTPFGQRVHRRLKEDTIAWLTTVGADGTPQPNPVWFVWDGADTILVYNRSDANRLTHIKSRPRVSINLDGDGHGGDIIILTGDAEVAEDAPPSHENAAYTAKYEAAATRISGTTAKFAAEYPIPLRIKITRVRGF